MKPTLSGSLLWICLFALPGSLPAWSQTNLEAIDTALSIYVPDDYPTLSEAYDSIKDKAIINDVQVRIWIRPGVFMEPGALVIDHAYGEHIQIQGTSSNAGDAVLQFSGTGIHLRRELFSLKNLTLAGTHDVGYGLWVDSGNMIDAKNLVIQGFRDGVRVRRTGYASVRNSTIEGAKNGIMVYDGGAMLASSNLIRNCTSFGVMAFNGGDINLDKATLEENSTAVMASRGAAVQLTSVVVSCNTCTGLGLGAEGNATILLSNTTITGYGIATVPEMNTTDNTGGYIGTLPWGSTRPRVVLDGASVDPIQETVTISGSRFGDPFSGTVSLIGPDTAETQLNLQGTATSGGTRLSADLPAGVLANPGTYTLLVSADDTANGQARMTVTIGTQGLAGTDGEDGTDGTDGTDGATWHNGTVSPPALTGNDGDYYLDTITGNVFRRDAHQWLPVGNLQGPAGRDGTQWSVGIGPVPADQDSVPGDLYLDSSSADFFRHEGGSWQLKGNLRGPAGANGMDARTWHNGSADPDGSVPAGEGDYYLNNSSGEIFQLSGGSWLSLIDLRGPADGATWYTGAADPTTQPAALGDLYLNTTTATLFTLQTSGWTAIAQLGGGSGSGTDLIQQDLTLHVPADFTDIHAALDHLAGSAVAPTATVTIQVADGNYSNLQTIEITHPNGDRIHILGNTTNPGACVLAFQSDQVGIHVKDGNRLGRMEGFHLFGGTRGVAAEHGGYIRLGGAMIIEGSNYGLFAYRGGTIVAGTSGPNGIHVHGNSSHGIYASTNSHISAEYGLSENNNGSGVRCDSSSSIRFQNGIARNNDQWGVDAHWNSHIDASNGSAAGNGQGQYRSSWSSTLIAVGTTASGINTYFPSTRIDSGTLGILLR